MSRKTKAAIAASAFLALLPVANAQEPAAAYRMRATVYKEDRIVAFATWIAYEDRTTTIRQEADTPYSAAIALTPAGKAAEGTLKTTLDLAVRPWRHNGSLVLNVDLQFHDTLHLNRYRSPDLVEELPTNESQGYGGDYEGIKSGDGWRFDLALNPEAEGKAVIEVEPAAIVEQQ